MKEVGVNGGNPFGECDRGGVLRFFLLGTLRPLFEIANGFLRFIQVFPPEQRRVCEFCSAQWLVVL